jgi:hypothetical protein
MSHKMSFLFVIPYLLFYLDPQILQTLLFVLCTL